MLLKDIKGIDVSEVRRSIIFGSRNARPVTKRVENSAKELMSNPIGTESLYALSAEDIADGKLTAEARNEIDGIGRALTKAGIRKGGVYTWDAVGVRKARKTIGEGKAKKEYVVFVLYRKTEELETKSAPKSKPKKVRTKKTAAPSEQPTNEQSEQPSEVSAS
jgi:hypothetical protein